MGKKLKMMLHIEDGQLIKDDLKKWAHIKLFGEKKCYNKINFEKILRQYYYGVDC